jgi:hypothetical protein
MISEELTQLNREVLIGLDYIQVYLLIQFMILFIFLAYNDPKNRTINLGWTVFFLIWAGVIFINIFRVFYIEEEPSQLLYNLMMVLALFGSSIIMNLLEGTLQYYLKTKYIFTILGYIASFIAIFLDTEQKRILMFVYVPIVLIFTIVFFKKLFINTVGKLKTFFILLIMGIYLNLAGFALMAPRFEFISNNLNLSMYSQFVIARLVSLIGFQLIAVTLIKFPIFYELNWRGQIKEMYIIKTVESVPISSYDFEKSEDQHPSKELIAGGMVGISQILKEISQSHEKLYLIDHQDKKLIIEHGKDIFVVAMAGDDFYVIREKIKQLIIIIEEKFGKILQNWNGNLDVFDDITGIVEKSFL